MIILHTNQLFKGENQKFIIKKNISIFRCKIETNFALYINLFKPFDQISITIKSNVI